MKNLRLLLDLDDVLVDFIGAACRQWRVNRDDLVRHWTAGEWSMGKPLGRLLHDLGRQPDPELTEAQFWRPIEGYEGFWQFLKPQPWAHDLLVLATVTDPEFRIVTSPSRCPTCYAGKRAWAVDRFGTSFDRLVLTNHKADLAKFGAVLIDDREETCLRFRAEGGHAILFPAHWNSLHEMKDDPMPHVRRELADLKTMYVD